MKEGVNMKEKLWTKEYLFSLLLVFGVNMGYALLNSVMAIYGTVLTSSSVMGGYMITVFTISALFVRLFIKKLNEKFSNKVLLIFGLCLTVIASIGYCLANDIVTFLIFRMIHGFGFGISLTCATAISNEYVPSSRLSEGVGFTSSANTIANAIGPTIALEILGEKYTNFFTLFAVLLIISAVILGLSLFVKSNTKAQKVNNEHQSYNGVIIACVFFLATFCQGAVNSFLTSYTKELNFGNIGLFFTLMAIVTFISRFFSRKIQNIFGLKKLSFILSIIMAVSIALIAFIQNEFQLFLLAIPLGLSTGLLFPIFNYRIIQTVDPSQFAFATSIYYCGLDIGYGLGAVVWGYVSQFFGYQVLYVVAALLIVVMIVFDQIVYQKVN
mgnify:FL=1